MSNAFGPCNIHTQRILQLGDDSPQEMYARAASARAGLGIFERQ